MAGDWHASAETVALVTGVIGGLLSAVGCLAGGWICDRMDRKNAYVIYGGLQAVCAIGMAFAPRTPWAYIVFTSLYAVITGLTYAGFTAFVLEAMGTGAAATKYNVFASISNAPIYFMTLTDGWAHTRWGAGGMLEHRGGDLPPRDGALPWARSPHQPRPATDARCAAGGLVDRGAFGGEPRSSTE